jgi:hypothetical protein
MRLKEIAERVHKEFGSDLTGTHKDCPLVNLVLRSKDSQASPGRGADRILLFAGIAAVAAVPSNSPRVLVGIGSGGEP